MNNYKHPLRFLLAVLIMTAFGSYASAQTQNHLILKKNGLHNRLQYFTGDEISFIRQGNSYVESGIIQGIGIDRIIIAGEEIPVSTISKLVYQRTSFNYRAGGNTIILASPLYLILGAVNAFIQDSRPIWTAGSFLVSGAIAATGVFISSLQVRKVSLGKKYQLRIVPSDPALNR